MPSDDERSRQESVDPKTLRLGPIRHESLSDEILVAIRRIHSVFAGVDGMTLEERENLFRRDVHPAREVATWLVMADVFERFCGSIELSNEAKRDVFSLVLMRSMATEEDTLERVKRTVLTEDEAREVLAGFL